MDPDAAHVRAQKRLVRPLRLTRIGMVAERFVHAFWPVWSILFAVATVVLLGLHETAPLEIAWIIALLALVGSIWFAIAGIRKFRWPSREEAMARLDATLPGNPIQALKDSQAIGTGDEASAAVWAAHLERMAGRAAGAKAVQPDLNLSRRDPFALRYVAATAIAVALLFGSLWHVATVGDVVTGGKVATTAAGPSWEGWIEPPAYTGKPSLYLNDIDGEGIAVPVGSRVTLRLYGEVGALSVDETVSARAGEEVVPASEPSQGFEINQSGRIAILGEGGKAWSIDVLADQPPIISLEGTAEMEANGRMSQPFRAQDDYGVVAGSGVIDLDLAAVERVYGLALAPEPRDPIELDLPMTIAGDRADFVETLVEDFSKHPWVGLPVTITLSAVDAAGQSGQSVPTEMVLPGRRFFEPLAAALIEQRRDLLWARGNGKRVAQVIRAVTHRPDDIIRDGSTFLPLRVALRRLEVGIAAPDGLSADVQEEVAEALWNIAVKIEEGDLSNALERLRRAQDRLSEAIRNGATDEEIAQLMDELREAMQEYMRQLAQQQDPDQQQQLSENTQEITGDQLQEMLDRLQQLMEEGRTAEAQQLLEQLRQMMENMQVTQGQQGQSGQSPGEQAMQGLAETLRDQQGLSDEAFRDLQEQFNPNRGQQGESGENEGRNGDMGRGQSHEGQNGQQPGGQQGQGGNQGRQAQDGQPGEGSLSERQGQLRQRLDSLRQNLPGAGTEQGDAARESLGDAGRAMDRAEDALENDDFAGAIDEQSRAMEAIREGMRNLGEAMAQEQQRQQGGQGQQTGQADGADQRDPLGRRAGTSGSFGTEENLLQGDDIYRRARELLDEIRRRSSDRERPELELDYLERLLDRF
ncbi:uncharacterized protein (TIGR02302 family) [Aliiruegeria haliotis]|uniref:Uncharacterized protein (TIGR02302 family) n=1 Tax=Aliiruegeria haliotis TaxID=1280846 RepID=A0A2T0RSZ6_9RHOB|nr:TIGR02302 family protein [Aliiruegeria haliotis]PRY24288.1 uncharacterized protein (TIGR02302 family) [Aliiruegeria haliotis]